MKILILCLCALMTLCTAQAGVAARPVNVGSPVTRGPVGAVGPGGVLKRMQVRVGDKFDVSWPLLKENNKSYGWSWTNKKALQHIVKLEKDSIADGKHTFTFKALRLPNFNKENPGELRIEFMNERPGQAQMTSAEGFKARYMNFIK